MIEDVIEDPGITGDNSSDEEVQVEHKTIPGHGTWVVTSSRGCLHVVGNCNRVPKTHYFNWVEVKTNVKEDHFLKACTVCFPRGYPLYSTEKV